MAAEFKIFLKKDASERRVFDVFCIQRVYSFSINDPLLKQKTQQTEFLIYDGGRWMWINSDDCYLKKD